MHLARAFLVSEGRLGFAIDSSGPIVVPDSFLTLRRTIRHARPTEAPRQFEEAQLERAFSVPLETDQRTTAPRASLHPPLGYLPAAAGVGLGRLIDWGAARLEILGRLGSLVVWLALGWWALHLAVRRRWAFCLLLLLPMSVEQGVALSSDAVCNGLAVLFLALVLRSASRTEPMTRAEVAALLVCAGALGFSKIGYAFLSALIFVVPARRFSGRAAWVAVSAAVVVAAFAPSLGWLLATSNASSTPASHLSVKGSPLEQLVSILRHPVAYAQVLIDTVALRGARWFTGAVGVLGHANLVLPRPLYALLPACLLAACLLDEPELDALRGGSRALVLAIALLGLIVVPTMGYLVWNPVGHGRINGIQGRYFLPVLPAVLMAIPSLGRRAPRLVRRAAPFVAVSVVVCGALGLAFALHAVLRAFYAE